MGKPQDSYDFSEERTSILDNLKMIGLQIDNLTLDGEIHRVPRSDQKDKRKLPCWYSGIQLDNGRIFVTAGDWRRPEDWHKLDSHQGIPLTSQQKYALQKIDNVTRGHRQQIQEETARNAQATFDHSFPAGEHCYFQEKGVSDPFARVEESTNALLVPLQDKNGKLTSLQRIFPNGKKRFLTGGKKKGCFHILPGKPGTLYIVEGYSTALSTREATGCTVWLAFDAGNLEPVAKIARERYRTEKQIVIAADNDHTKKDNAGLTFGTKAAQAIGASLIYPEGIKGSDFNDMAAELGIDAVRQCLQKIPPPLAQQSEQNSSPEPLEDLPSKDGNDRNFFFRPVYTIIENIREPQWLIRDILEQDCLAVLFAAPGNYKSFLSLDWALCIATGTPWLGHKVRQGPVIAILGEGSNGYGRRVKAWEQHRKVDLSRAPFFVSNRSASLSDPLAAEQVAESINGIVTDLGESPALILIDTLARNFAPGDENSTRDMSLFVSHLDRYLRGDNGTTSRLLVHHSGHGQTRARGSSVLIGALDAEYKLVKEDSLRARLFSSKMKDAPEFSPIDLQAIEVDIPVVNPTPGVRTTSLVLNQVDLINSEQNPFVDTGLTGKQVEACYLLAELVSDAQGWEKLKPIQKIDWSDACIEHKITTKTGSYDLFGKIAQKGMVTLDKKSATPSTRFRDFFQGTAVVRTAVSDEFFHAKTDS